MVVEEIVFQSADGEYTVIRGRSEEAQRESAAPTAVGNLGTVRVGETLRLQGQFRDHPTYGRRFQVRSFAPVTPDTETGIKRYLGSGLVPGVGPKIAERLVEAFGTQTLEVIAEHRDKLLEVEGIGGRRAEAISDAVLARRAEVAQLGFLHGLGLGPATANRVLRRYGAEASRVVRDNPYRIAEEVPGLGFKMADRIGTAVGVAPSDPRRAAGALLHSLSQAADDGDAFLDAEELFERIKPLNIEKPAFKIALEDLQKRELIHVDSDSIYAPPLFKAEVSIASDLTKLLRRPAAMRASEPKAAAAARSELLSDQQRFAVDASMCHRVLVVTGGPGTGKTTTIRAIVDAHQAAGHRIALCAPTGRAARRMSEATGFEAKTIHRTLEWAPGYGFRRNRAHPIDAELILVDEASMVDLHLAAQLLEAIAPSSRIVWVGDIDQLPSVGAGKVLEDLIDSGVVETVRFGQVFRQAAESAIVQGAHAILSRKVPKSTEQAGGRDACGDLFLVREKSSENIAQKLIHLIERMHRAYGLDPMRDIQVLAPMRRGPAGTDALNQVLAHHLNPGRPRPHPGSLAPGDKVMQLRNNYDKEVYNGDIGHIRHIEGGSVHVMIESREVIYAADETDELTLSYASTVHKVQGSEFPSVIMVLHASHHVLLSRSLVYTGLTRARKLAVFLGDPGALERSVKRSGARARNSHLAPRLRQLASSASVHGGLSSDRQEIP